MAGKMLKELFQAFRPFYNAKGVYDIYGVLLRAKPLVNKDILLEDWAPEYIQAFKATIFNYKCGKVRNLHGYLFSTWQSITAWISRKMNMNNSGIFYDWLTEDVC